AHTHVQGPLRHLNEGITLSVRSRIVCITTSRGTEAVQLTSNMISSVLKSSRSIAILSTTASGVPKRLTSACMVKKLKYFVQYLCQLRKAEGGFNGMNTAQASNLVENLG